MWLSGKDDYDRRVSDDESIISSANELGELAVTLGAQKEKYDEAKLSFAESVVTDNIGQAQLTQGQTQYNEGASRLDAAKAQYAEGQTELDEAGAQLESGRATLNSNKSKLAEHLDELESYSDDLERLEHGAAILMNDDEISSRAGDNASYADICSIAEEHYGNDITRAERENNIRSVICALTFASAPIIAGCAMLYKHQSRGVAVLAAISSIISGGCALAAAILGTSVILPIAALSLMLMTLLFGEIYLKRSNK